MLQNDLNKENKEIREKAYKLYEKHGFKDGNDFVDWLEAEKQTGKPDVEKQTTKRTRSEQNKTIRNILLAIVGMLSVIVVILLIMLFTSDSRMELSGKGLSELKTIVLVLDPKGDEKILAFGDTHFDFDQSTLSDNAKVLLDRDVLTLKENPKVNVRMAGYTSAQGTKDVNQKISEKRANVVRDYLIEKGIAPERITVIGYGRTRPAVYEAAPGNIKSKAALANMRVLFEVVVK
ncbi:OmpA family protein [candidate division KSB1 bacterium]|nr:OmpA family protein [candidate division KSB1 bacterium]